MNKTSEQQRIEEILRRQGVTQQSRVETLVSEVRSDFVPIFPPPFPPQPNGILGGVVVIWQFCLRPDEVAEFHQFLRNTEDFIGTATLKSVEGAYYRGTYMVLVGGEECCRPTSVGFCYRVIWAYESLDAMGKAWNSLARDAKSNLYKAIVQLRSYWLRDPQRSEVRTAPAVGLLDPETDAGDGFAKLTSEAAKLVPQRLSGASEGTAGSQRGRAATKPKKK